MKWIGIILFLGIMFLTTCSFASTKPVEAFGAGTAAMVAPIQTIGVDGELYHLPAYNRDSVMFNLKRELEAIRTGRAVDVYGWNVVV